MTFQMPNVARAFVDRYFRPPRFAPGYEIIEFLAQDQRALAQGRFLSADASEKGEAIVAEKHNELLQEATRLVDRDLRLVADSQKLHANAVQFGLAAAAIVASLGAWLNLHFVWIPLTAFIASIATAWWFLCQEPPDWMSVVKDWHANMPELVGEVKVPDRFRKEMYAHMYARLYYSAIRKYRRWLHQSLAIPALLFVIGLVLLVACIETSG